MSDLISRQAAIDALNEYFARIGKLKRKGLTKGEKAISLDTVGTIKTLPSAEPKTGEWIDRSDGGRILYPWWESCECSQCGEYGSGAYDFCPNCGADMRPKGDDDEKL